MVLGKIFKGGKREVYAYISSEASVDPDYQKSMIKLWSSLSRNKIVAWFRDESHSLLKALSERPLPVVVFDSSFLREEILEAIHKLNISIINVKPKEGPPTVGC